MSRKGKTRRAIVIAVELLIIGGAAYLAAWVTSMVLKAAGVA